MTFRQQGEWAGAEASRGEQRRARQQAAVKVRTMLRQ